MSCSKFLGTMAALVALSPFSFAQSTQDKALEEIKQSLAELRKENADLKQRLNAVEVKPVTTSVSRMDFDREMAELSSRFAAARETNMGNEHKGTPLTFTGNLRERFEWQSQPTGDDDFRILSRLTLNMDWMVTDHVKVFAQLRDSRRFGDAAVTEFSNTNAVDTTDDSATEMHQVYMWLKDFIGTGLDFKIGRQEMVLGSERLVGDNDWNNVGRSFEGVRADGTWDDFRYSLYMMVVANTPYDQLYRDQRLYGLFFDHPLLGDALNLEGYAMYFSDDLNDNHLQTYGGRLKGRMDLADYSFEAATQQNMVNDASMVDFHEAYFFHGDIGFSVDDLDGKPRLSFAYDMGTDLFNFMFPDNHARFGHSDIISSGTNLVHWGAMLDLDVYDGWKLGFEYHWNRAWKQAGADGLGNELDVTLRGKCGEHVWVDIAAGHNFGDEGLATRGSGPTWTTPGAGEKDISSTFLHLQFTVPF